MILFVDTVLVQQVDFLETILEETSDDLQSDSDRSGTTYWLGSDSETESVIHIRAKQRSAGKHLTILHPSRPLPVTVRSIDITERAVRAEDDLVKPRSLAARSEDHGSRHYCSRARPFYFLFPLNDLIFRPIRPREPG